MDDDDLDAMVRKALSLKEAEPDWSPQQLEALERIHEWLAEGEYSPQVFRLFGYAGTGKTTLARHILPHGNVVFATYTNKAAAVMRKKGCAGATTIDKLIYKPTIEISCIDIECKPERCPKSPCKNRRERWVGRSLDPESDALTADLVIIDECSMVDYQMGMDLLKVCKKLLVIGDPAQLPPIAGAGYFTECEPDFLLTEVHRQAAGSPVLTLATRVRNRQSLLIGSYRDSHVVYKRLPAEMLASYDQVLVGTHSTRMRVNREIRKVRGFTDEVPEAGEKILCLVNRVDRGLRNGTLWRVVKAYPPFDGFVRLEITEEDDAEEKIVEVTAPILGFTLARGLDGLPEDVFMFGYAITVHKSQGSQWPSVCVLDDAWLFEYMAAKKGEVFDKSRWLYTAITRAAERVIIGC